MPRIKSSQILKLQIFVQIFGANKFKTDGNVLHCNICNKSITADRKSQVDQHIKVHLMKAISTAPVMADKLNY